MSRRGTPTLRRMNTVTRNQVIPFASALMLALLAAATGCGSSSGGGSSSGDGGGKGEGGSGASTTSSAATGGKSSSTSGTAGGSASSSTGAGAGTGGAPVEGWGEDPPGVTVEPFDYFKAFRSGCGEQLWMRFFPSQDFGMTDIHVEDSGGGSLAVTFFDVPQFGKGQKTIYSVDHDHGGWGEGTATFSMTVAEADGSVLNHMLTVPIDKLYRAPGQIEYVSSRNGDSATAKGLQVTVTPHVSGDVGRAFVFNDDDECVAYSNILVEPVKITKEVTTELNIGAPDLTSGKSYVLSLEGNDSARDYVYFTTLEFTAP